MHFLLNTEARMSFRGPKRLAKEVIYYRHSTISIPIATSSLPPLLSIYMKLLICLNSFFSELEMW